MLAPTTITFHYAANGVDVVKTIQFDSSYVIDIETKVQAQRRAGARAGRVAAPALATWKSSAIGLATRGQVRTTPRRTSPGRIDGKESSLAAAKVSGNNTLDQPYQYAAVIGSLLCRGLPA